MRDRCDHAPAGACDDPTCGYYAGHRCLSYPCRTVGCEHSRPAPGDPDAALVAALSAPVLPDPNPADYDPAAVRAWEETQRLAGRDNASGDLTRGRGFVGQNERGGVNTGSSSWEYLRVVGHKDGVAVRQDQPVFVKGAVYPSAPQEARARRERTEAEAQRMNEARDREAEARPLRDLARGDLASRLGMSPARMRRLARGV